ncbi:MAG: hypothetical protein ABWY57_15115, partial [Mycetocola sp.]
MNDHPQDSNDARDPHDAAGAHPTADAASNSWTTPDANKNVPPAPTYFPEYTPPGYGDTAATDAYPQAPGAAFGVGSNQHTTDQPTNPTGYPTEPYPAFAGTHQQFSGQHYPGSTQNTHPYG